MILAYSLLIFAEKLIKITLNFLTEKDALKLLDEIMLDLDCKSVPDSKIDQLIDALHEMGKR
jgi:hypothetical protein